METGRRASSWPHFASLYDAALETIVVESVLQLLCLIAWMSLVSNQKSILCLVFRKKSLSNPQRVLIHGLDCVWIAMGYLLLRGLLAKNIWMADILRLWVLYSLFQGLLFFRPSVTALRRGFLYLSLLLSPYLVLESLLSLSHRGSFPQFAWFIEGTDQAFTFDPAFGFKVSKEPVKVLDAYDGRIEYFSQFRGNNLGLLDKDDIHPRRGHQSKRRLAVLGDSFTAGEYLSMNWPDKLERVGGFNDWELLNFALPGIGLPNWWTLVTRHLTQQPYELDGVLFAVHRDNLSRRFTYFRKLSNGDFAPVNLHHLSKWRLPETEQEAEPFIREQATTGTRLSAGELESLRRGEWPERLLNPFRFELAHRIHLGLRQGFGKPYGWKQCPSRKLTEAQYAMIDDIRAFLTERGLPVFVVYIPRREELMRSPKLESCAGEVARFAKLLNASFYDGREAFKQMTDKEIRSYYFPNDGHWNQLGSDLFAATMLRELNNWVAIKNHG